MHIIFDFLPLSHVLSIPSLGSGDGMNGRERKVPRGVRKLKPCKPLLLSKEMDCGTSKLEFASTL